MSEQSNRPSPLEGTIVLACTALGAALRLHALTRASLWVDEIYGLREITAPTWRASLALIRDDFTKTPIDFLLARLFVLLTGAQLEMIRLWPALVGTLAIPLTWLWVRAFRVRGAAPLAALLLALSAFHITHSQELRFYSLFTLLTVAVLWTFTQMMKQPHRAVWPPLCAASLWLAYHTFALAVLLLLPLLLTLLLDAAVLFRREGMADSWRERRDLWRRLAIAGAAAGVASLPWYLWDTRHERGIEAFGMQVTGGVDAGRILELFFQMSGRSVLLMVFFTAAILGGAWAAMRRGEVAPLALAVGLPLLVGAQAWLMVRAHYWFLLRQCVQLVPLWLGLAALGLAPVLGALWRKRLFHRALAIAVVAAIVLLQIPGLRALRLQWNENWREAAHVVTRTLRPEDTLVIQPCADYFLPYWPEAQERMNAGSLSAEEVALTRTHGRVFVFVCSNVEMERYQRQRRALEGFPRVTLALWDHAQLIIVPAESESPPQLTRDLLTHLPVWPQESQWLLGSLAQQALIQNLPWSAVASLIERMGSSTLSAFEPCELLAISLQRRGHALEAQRLLHEAIRIRRLRTAQMLSQRPGQWEGIAADQEALGQPDAAAASRRHAEWWKRLIPGV